MYGHNNGRKSNVNRLSVKGKSVRRWVRRLEHTDWNPRIKHDLQPTILLNPTFLFLYQPSGLTKAHWRWITSRKRAWVEWKPPRFPDSSSRLLEITIGTAGLSCSVWLPKNLGRIPNNLVWFPTMFDIQFYAAFMILQYECIKVFLPRILPILTKLVHQLNTSAGYKLPDN